jgi:MFS family permease
MPALGSQLDAGAAALQWTLNGYLLVLASLILIGGALGDRFGRRRMLVAGAAGFTIASLLCVLSPSVEWLIAFRALQGLAAAVLTPQSLAIIHVSFRQEDRGRAIGAWSALGGIAAAVGPVLGGWLIDVASWRWMFFLDVPVAAAVVALAIWKVPESRNPGARRLDAPGAVTAFLALGGVSWALIHGPENRWESASVWGAGALGIAMLVVFLAIELREDPLVDAGCADDPVRRIVRSSSAAGRGQFTINGAVAKFTPNLRHQMDTDRKRPRSTSAGIS